MGFWRLKWLHLKRQSIEWTERIKTCLRSVGGRIYGRPDERINPSDTDRTTRNWVEVFRIHKQMQSMIGHSLTTSESWKNLPWKQFRRNLFRLQRRVFKAVSVGDKRKAMSLQKLILKSLSARMLAIRQVTQLNAGKKTAGIDGKKSQARTLCTATTSRKASKPTGKNQDRPTNTVSKSPPTQNPADAITATGSR